MGEIKMPKEDIRRKGAFGGAPQQGGFEKSLLDYEKTDIDLNNTPASASEPAHQSADAPQSYEDILAQLQKKQDEDTEVLARRRRANEMIGSIADAGRAVANLYATTKGAPNAYDPATSMADNARERYERAKAELDRTNAQRMAYAGQLEAARRAQRTEDISRRRLDIQERESERKRADNEANRQIRAQIANNNLEIAKIRKEVEDGKLDARAAEARIKEINAQSSWLRAQAAAYGTESTIYTYNDDGDKTGMDKVKGVGGVANRDGGSGNGGNGGGNGTTVRAKDNSAITF